MLKAHDTSGNVLFEEKQKYPRWIYYLVSGILLVAIVVMVVAAFYSGEGGLDLWLSLAIVIATEILLGYLLRTMQLEKIVTTNGLYYRWRPWHKRYRYIEKEDIESCEVRRFPFLSYGFGWFPGYGWYHHASSGDGLQLYLKTGKRFYFSTSDIVSLTRAMNNLITSNAQNQL